MRRAGLRTRVARLQRQRQVRRLPRVIVHIYDIAPSEIVGFRGGGTMANLNCDRAPGEAVNDCASRAFDECLSMFVAAVYAH